MENGKQNPYSHEVDDQRSELTAAFETAFEDAGPASSPERLAQVAVGVVCDNTLSTLDLIAAEDDWIAGLMGGDDNDSYGGPFDYRTIAR